MEQSTQIEQKQQRLTATEEEEMEELQTKRTMYDRAYELAEKFASNSLGQYVLVRCDRMLKMVEDTAKWSLPQEKNDCKLERPLPWIPFLFMIIVLRFTRIYMSVVALAIGNRTVTPQDMISFIQSRRRILRAIRMHGMKVIERRQSDCLASKSTVNDGLVGKLRSLMSRAICRPGQLAKEPARRVFIHHLSGKTQTTTGTTTTEMSDSDRLASNKRPRDDETGDMNLTFDEKLNKYANENSDDDSDYVPNFDEETNDDSTSSNDTSSSSEEEEEIVMESEKAMQKTIDLNNSSDVKLNGGNYANMPKPIVEMKKETSSDTDSKKEQQTSKTLKANGPLNGGLEKKVTDIAAHSKETNPKTPTNNTTNINNNNDKQNLLINGKDSLAQQQPTATATQQKTAQPETTNTTTTTATATATSGIVKPKAYNSAITTAAELLNLVATDLCSSLDISSEIFPFESHCLPHPISSSISHFIPPSSSLSSSLDSLETCDNFIVNEAANEMYSMLTPASSSEDLFYSPIGSPIDFNACLAQQKQIQMKSNAESFKNVEAHSTPTEVSGYVGTYSPSSSTSTSPRSSITEPITELTTEPLAATQQQKQQHHSHNKPHYNNRYRGKNRR